MSVYLIYYFLLDIIIRLLMQKYPFLDVKPYLTLPIPKRTLIHSLLLKSLRSFFNFLPLFVILPFTFRSVIPTEGLVVGFTFLLFFIGMVFFNNYLSFLLDKYFKAKPLIAILVTGALLVTLYLDFTGTIGLREWLEPIFGKVLHFTPSFIAPFWHSR